MVTQFQIDCALMAGASYISTRSDINKFPMPQGWIEQINLRARNDSSGFEATTFKNGTSIVISYAGTNPNSLLDPDNAANIGLATGFGSDQLLQAAEYYLQVKAANPTATSITFTGHSLGGGLAALMGVFFGQQAVTFDQAPFANSAELNVLTPDVAANLKAALLASGHTEAELASLTNFVQLRDTNGGIPNSNLVTGLTVQGQLLSNFPYTLFDPIGGHVDILNSANGVSGLDLHSQALLTAFVQSLQTASPQQTLSDVTYKLTDLLGMIFDENLYEHPTNDPDNENFGGIFSSPPNNVSKALIAFTMQMYYEDTANATNVNKELFTDLATAGLGSGGVQFDRADVAASLDQAKGYTLYFQDYLDSDAFTNTERQLIQSLLPTLRDWYVQAGNVSYENSFERSAA